MLSRQHEICIVTDNTEAEIIKGERVLALFPYTTSFYAGQIVSTEAHERYGVRFDDDVEDGKIVKKRKYHVTSLCYTQAT